MRFSERRSAPSLSFDDRHTMNTWLKKTAFVGLLLLGCTEIFYGLWWGRLRSNAYEAPFASAVKSSDWTPEQYRAYGRYITIFKDQWGIVAMFGAVTVVLAV